jgi:uncharacterized membrane protein YgcG
VVSGQWSVVRQDGLVTSSLTADHRPPTTLQKGEAMKGFISKVVATLGFAGSLAVGGGCASYRDVVDPCYPERYEYQARQNNHADIAPQVRNGHVLDQTVWNYHFEDGTDRLTAGGQERLKYIGRRRPCPDPMVFLQTADVAYNPDKPEELPQKRAELDAKRAVAIKKFLMAQTAGGPPLAFEVLVHNPPEVGIAGAAVETSLRLMYSTPRATLPGTGASSSGGGGASSGGGGGGGSAGGGAGGGR